MENVNRGKKIYNKPMLMSEAFLPNQYVAACFSLTCEFGAGAGDGMVSGECTTSGGGNNRPGNRPGNNNYNDVHQKQYCGTAGNQAIVVDGRLDNLENLTAAEVMSQIRVVEINSSNNGSDLLCTITGYDVDTKTVHWQNGYDGMTFCHRGVIDLSDGNRINAS